MTNMILLAGVNAGIVLRAQHRTGIEQQQNGGYTSYNYSILRKRIVCLISLIDQEQHTTMPYEF